VEVVAAPIMVARRDMFVLVPVSRPHHVPSQRTAIFFVRLTIL
jgi:hypothetical protein